MGIRSRGGPVGSGEDEVKIPALVDGYDRKSVLNRCAGRSSIGRRCRPSGAAVGGFQKIDLIRAPARGECRVDVAVVLVDGEVVLARKTLAAVSIIGALNVLPASVDLTNQSGPGAGA